MEETKPKLVVMLSRFPYPLEKGDKLRAYYQIKDLSRHFNIHLICTTDQVISPEIEAKLKPYCTEITLFNLKIVGLFYSILRAFITGGPIQVAYFYRYSIHRAINKKLQQIQPDLIYCQLVRVAEYVKNYHACPKILDYMDVLSVGMSRRTTTAPVYQKWFFRREYERLRRYESTVFEYFEKHTMISSQDSMQIHHPKNSCIEIVKNGVDELFLTGVLGEKKYDLLFCGNMSYQPNIEAALFIVDKILPALKLKGYDFSLMIAGASPTKEILALKSDKVIVTGWLDDIRKAYSSSYIFVAPMFIGTGLQNKLLEAMAMGLPCVTTELANNALEGENGHNIHLAEKIEQFVEKLISLRENKDIFISTTHNGRKFVEQKYTWGTQNEHLYGILKSLLSQRF